MNLILHILRKDIQRLWWEISLTWTMLAVVAYSDARSGESQAGFLAAIFSFVLPIGGAYLIALVVQQEKLSGTAVYWRTRPVPKWVLVAEKALFLAFFVQFSLFLSDFWALLATGFGPWEYLPELLSRQAVLAVTLTLPAFALAAVTRSLFQFAGFAFALFLLQLTLIDLLRAPNWALGVLVALPFACGCLALLWFAYGARRIWVARGAGLAGLAAALLVAGFTPRNWIYSLSCAAPAGSEIRIRIDPDRRPGAEGNYNASNGWTVAAVPVEVHTPAGIGSVDLSPLTWTADTDTGSLPPGNEGFGWFLQWTGTRLYVNASPEAWTKLSANPIAIHGQALAQLSRMVPAGEIPADGQWRFLPGLGRCRAGMSPASVNLVDLVCESPRPARGVTAQSEHLRPGLFAVPPVPAAYATWLSPLQRRHESLPLLVGSVPAGRTPSVAELGPLNVQRVEDCGCAVVPFDLRDLDLNRWRVRPE